MINLVNNKIKTAALLLTVLTSTAASAALSLSGNVTTPSSSSDLYLGFNSHNGTLTLNGDVTPNGTNYIKTKVGNLGYHAGTTGTVNLDGANTHWEAKYYNSADLNVGVSGKGILNIKTGAKATTDDDANIGLNSNAEGTINVDGAGSHLQVRDYIRAGYSGKGTLNITNGATAQTTNGVKVGYKSGSDGRVNVDGAGSHLDIHCGVYIGNSSTGRMDVTNGGLVTNYGRARVGVNHGTSGVLNVSGQGSVFTTRGSTLVNGYCGVGRIDISDGGQVFNTNGSYSNNSASTLAFGLSADYLEPNDFWAMNISGNVHSLGLLDVYLTDGYVLGANQVYDFFNIGGAICAEFDGFGQNSMIGEFDGIELFIDYHGGDGNDIVLYTNDDGTPPGGEPGNPNAVPEPVTFALSSLALLALNSKCGRRSHNG